MAVEHGGDDDTKFNESSCNGQKTWKKRLGKLKIRKNPHQNTTEIDKDTEKSPGDLKRLAVT